MWLLLGLEFELAADIISSVVSPTWQDLGELGAIAPVIRTFLNYFLERDLESAERGEAERLPYFGRSSSKRMSPSLYSQRWLLVFDVRGSARFDRSPVSRQNGLVRIA